MSPWDPALVPLPFLIQLKKTKAEYADVRFTGTPAERELLVTFAGNGPEKEARDALARWGALVGHRRLWLSDELIDLRGDLPEPSDAVVECPSCKAPITAGGPDFWLKVRTCGYFPGLCAFCGGTLPEWGLVGEREGMGGRS